MPERSPAVDVAQTAFAARARRDFDALAQCFTPDARWLTIDDGPWSCENREAIIATMRANNPDTPDDFMAEVEQVGERVVVGFRAGPSRRVPARRLDHGLVYLVVSLRDELICELKVCADRASAVAYAIGARSEDDSQR